MKDTFTQLEVRQVELEQQVITLQSAQTQTTVQHNNTLFTRPGVLEVERDLSAFWTVVRQHLQEKEQDQENRALEERIRVLEERVRG
jgi:cell division protein FtsB